MSPAERRQLCIAAANKLEQLAKLLRTQEAIALNFRWTHEGRGAQTLRTQVIVEVDLDGIVEEPS
jgi:hypothetical protein